MKIELRENETLHVEGKSYVLAIARGRKVILIEIEAGKYGAKRAKELAASVQRSKDREASKG